MSNDSYGRGEGGHEETRTGLCNRDAGGGLNRNDSCRRRGQFLCRVKKKTRSPYLVHEFSDTAFPVEDLEREFAEVLYQADPEVWGDKYGDVLGGVPAEEGDFRNGLSGGGAGGEEGGVESSDSFGFSRNLDRLIAEMRKRDEEGGGSEDSSSGWTMTSEEEDDDSPASKNTSSQVVFRISRSSVLSRSSVESSAPLRPRLISVTDTDHGSASASASASRRGSSAAFSPAAPSAEGATDPQHSADTPASARTSAKLVPRAPSTLNRRPSGAASGAPSPRFLSLEDMGRSSQGLSSFARRASFAPSSDGKGGGGPRMSMSGTGSVELGPMGREGEVNTRASLFGPPPGMVPAADSPRTKRASFRGSAVLGSGIFGDVGASRGSVFAGALDGVGEEGASALRQSLGLQRRGSARPVNVERNRQEDYLSKMMRKVGMGD